MFLSLYCILESSKQVLQLLPKDLLFLSLRCTLFHWEVLLIRQHLKQFIDIFYFPFPFRIKGQFKKRFLRRQLPNKKLHLAEVDTKGISFN